jgi:hypothetical protein
MSGPVFGFSALKELLITKGRAFEDSCRIVGSARECQDAQLDTIALLSFFAADASMIAFGEISDKVGPAYAFVTGLVFTIVGFGSIGVNGCYVEIGMGGSVDWLWYFAFLAIGLGGPGIFMGCFALAEKNPRVENILSGVIAGMFDASSVVFLLFRILLSDYGISFHTLCFGWCALLFCIGGTFLAEINDAMAPPPSSPQSAPLQSEQPKSDGLLASLMRIDTLLLLVFMSVCNLKGSFFIATFDEQTQYLPATDVQKQDLLSFWYMALPFGGVVMSFVAPAILANGGGHHAWPFLCTLVLAAAQAACNLFLNIDSQYMAAALLGPCRTLLWASYFSYIGSAFPPDVVGRVLGYVNLPIALVSDAFPIAVTSIINSGRDPTSGHTGETPFGTANLLSTLLLACCIAFPAHLLLTSERKQKIHPVC